jgi:hypothetical protein
MVLISLIFIFQVHAKELEKFLTKFNTDTIRFIDQEGQYAYISKRPGSLSLVNNFKSEDFLFEGGESQILMKGSPSRQRLLIEVIPSAWGEFNLIKNRKISVIDLGSSKPRFIAEGLNPELHLNDEWISYFSPQSNKLHFVHLMSSRKFEIVLIKKTHPFFTPEVLMLSNRGVLYTDQDDKGFAILVSVDLQTQKKTIHYKSSQSAVRIELCQDENYIAVGEFPYDGVKRSSLISTLPTSEVMNLSNLTTVYKSQDGDLGHMICKKEYLYFIKTLKHEEKLNLKTTEVAKLNLQSQSTQAITHLNNVSQIIDMDGRIMVPFRGNYYVIEGKANIGMDQLKKMPEAKELELDI